MLNINIKFTGIEHDDSVSNYIYERFKKLEKFVNRLQDEVIFRVEVGRTTHHHMSGDVYRAELTTHIAGSDYRAESTKDDMYSAIDAVRDEILTELKKSKGKSEAMARRAGRKVKKLIRKFYS